ASGGADGRGVSVWRGADARIGAGSGDEGAPGAGCAGKDGASSDQGAAGKRHGSEESEIDGNGGDADNAGSIGGHCANRAGGDSEEGKRSDGDGAGVSPDGDQLSAGAKREMVFEPGGRNYAIGEQAGGV